ncbi:hypothetical protein BFP72_11535 [Reichenbachiella sp. 5M10]|uniref:3-keto-disaccharide hydrolase n=1 Tax=Reichenbachiella sp. 5M10 TaxID=1889772 RepID=UPI000C160855|nr:DUF1080 domain-containing protein [Reichenbachiella sp. 5M10]PIB35982.1 hypothetical protein BFP72_11535 [Reichenbachiella sp. 5M10]
MKSILNSHGFLAMVLAGVFISCQESKWEPLFDADMTQWDTYLSYKHQYGYQGAVPLDEDSVEIPPVGLNPEGYGVFQMVEQDGEPVLQVSGEYYGCAISKVAYDNYHFRIQVKWGDKQWPPREHLLKDAGILYHSIGEPGVEYWRSWMLSQEFQIMEGHMGDYWSQATSAIDIRAYIPEGVMSPVADVSQPFLPMGQGQESGGYCMRSANHEVAGEWTTLDLICFEDKSVHIVNGQIVMVLRHSRYEKDGQMTPLIRGKIQLQSEAAEVYYKGAEIRPLEAMPPAYAALFD